MLPSRNKKHSALWSSIANIVSCSWNKWRDRSHRFSCRRLLITNSYFSLSARFSLIVLSFCFCYLSAAGTAACEKWIIHLRVRNFTEHAQREKIPDVNAIITFCCANKRKSQKNNTFMHSNNELRLCLDVDFAFVLVALYFYC